MLSTLTTFLRTMFHCIILWHCVSLLRNKISLPIILLNHQSHAIPSRHIFFFFIPHVIYTISPTQCHCMIFYIFILTPFYKFYLSLIHPFIPMTISLTECLFQQYLMCLKKSIIPHCFCTKFSETVLFLFMASPPFRKEDKQH